MRWTERQRAMLRAMGIAPWAGLVWPAVTVPVVRPAGASPPAAGPSVAADATTAPNVRAMSARRSAPPSAPQAAPHVLPADARARAIAAMDWPALQEAVRACQACALHGERRQTVFGVGHASAHWMIVGEAPGEQEDREGEPFVGAAGQLLDRMLLAIGLTRASAPPEQQVYIANTLKCRPPRNRNPEPAETAACAPFLARQIELIRPRMLLAMGRFAAQHLLGTDEAIGRLRGRLHAVTLADGQTVPVVVTYHPAYLLRNPADKARSWADLCLARLTLGGVGAESRRL